VESDLAPVRLHYRLSFLDMLLNILTHIRQVLRWPVVWFVPSFEYGVPLHLEFRYFMYTFEFRLR
jgi:hypothetical protein